MMTLKEALEILANHYGVETDGEKILGLTTYHAPFPYDVWRAWEVVLKRIEWIKVNKEHND